MEGGDPELRRMLPAVFLSTYFIRFGFGITLSVFAFYLGAGTTNNFVVVALAAAAAPLIEASTVLFSGLAADRYGRFPILKVGLLVGAILLFLMSTNRDALAQTLLSGFLGFCSGAILSSSLAIAGDATPFSERGLEMGRFDAVNLFGWISGFAAGYILVSALEPGLNHPERLAPAFWVGGAAVLLAFLLAWHLTSSVKEKKARHLFDRERFRRAVLDPDILLVVLPWGTIYMLLGALLTFLGTAATSKTIGLKPWELGVAILVGGSILLVTQPFYGRMTDRLGRSKIMQVGILGFLGILASAGVLTVEGFDHPLVSYPAAGALGVSVIAALAFGPSSLAALADLSLRLSRGTTMALYIVMIAAGMAVGILLSAVLFNALGNDGILVFFGIVGGFLILLTLLRMHREPRPAAT